MLPGVGGRVSFVERAAHEGNRWGTTRLQPVILGEQPGYSLLSAHFSMEQTGNMGLLFVGPAASDAAQVRLLPTTAPRPLVLVYLTDQFIVFSINSLAAGRLRPRS